MLRTVLVCALAAGCLEARLVPCGDLDCPVGDVCTPGGCATAADAEACAGKADGDACITGTTAGTCSRGSCHAAGCGNGIVDSGEVCDDGNQIAGDGCSADCLSTEVCGNDIVDGRTQEQCDGGVPGLSGDGCSSRCQLELGVWRDVTPAAMYNPDDGAMVYDPNRHLTVLFGGLTGLDATWEWDGANWTRRLPPVSPVGRYGHGMVYDTQRHRVVLFGGRTEFGGPLNDTWEWDGVVWTERATNAAIPPRLDMGIAYDSVRDRIVVFGGNDSHAALGDLWELDGATWIDVQAANAPDARQRTAMAFDATHQVTVLFGGEDAASNPIAGDTFLWTGATWTKIPATGTPSGRAGHRLVYDSADEQIALFGGSTSDVFMWNGASSSWTTLPSPAFQPVNRTDHAMAYDTTRSRLIVFGAAGNNVWEADLSTTPTITWVERLATTPAPRRDLPLVYDAAIGRVVAFGGSTGVTTYADTWEWDGSTWQQHADSSPPVKRSCHAATYDSDRHLIVMFGGQDSVINVYGDTWEWDPSGWQSRVATKKPPARAGAALAYDNVRRRSVLFGGTDNAADIIDKDPIVVTQPATWEWDGATWNAVATAALPKPRSYFGLAFDEHRQRTVLFGGHFDNALANGVLGDTWEWDGAAWTDVTPATSPAPRWHHALIYDPLRQRIVMFGGQNATQDDLGDTWSWDGTSWTQESELVSLPGRESPAAYDRIHHQIVAFDGVVDASEVAETWTQSFLSVTGSPELCVRAADDTDGDGLAGCADPDCAGRCTPDCTPGEPCDPSRPHCGDGTCSSLEDFQLCPADCSAP